MISIKSAGKLVKERINGLFNFVLFYQKNNLLCKKDFIFLQKIFLDCSQSEGDFDKLLAKYYVIIFSTLYLHPN